MIESSYGSQLADKIEKEIGGKVIKRADKSTLGLADYDHIHNGIITFIETKHNKDVIDRYVYPWNEVTKMTTGIRQYEVIKRMSTHALCIYAIYYSKIKMSCVLTAAMMAEFRDGRGLGTGLYLRKGHGIDLIKEYEEANKKRIIQRLING